MACLPVGLAHDWEWRRGCLLGCLHHQLLWLANPVSFLSATPLEKVLDYHWRLQQGDMRESFLGLDKENYLAQGRHHQHPKEQAKVTCPDRAEAWIRGQSRCRPLWTDFSASKVLPPH